MLGRKILVAAVLLLAALGLIAFLRFSPWVAQDICLDGGGAWHGGSCVH